MRFASQVAGVAGVASLLAASQASCADAYAMLSPYAGRWSVVTSRGKTIAVVNSCARTGLFYVCEQSINGSSKTLVVFLPRAGADDGGRYRTQTLSVDGAAPGPWFSLTIKDADWVYTPEGAQPRERTVDHFIDADHIHFTVQKKLAEDWKTTLSGDETRIN